MAKGKAPPTGEEARELIRAEALASGFDAAGFARAELSAATRQDLQAFLDQDRHGDMAWMTDPRRSDPRALWPDAVTVVVLGSNYAPADGAAAFALPPDRGRISVYARNRDYHDLVKKRLKQLTGWMQRTFGAEVKVFVDTAAIMEKPLAQAAGLGWQGRHTCLVSRQAGAWLFLGEVFTTLDLPPDPPHADRCGTCRACVDACPTGALSADGRIDARRCISYLTIEHKGDIPEDLRPLLGNRIYGCDDCLAACPWNHFATPTAEEGYLPRAELAAPRLADLAALDAEAFAAVFRGSPIKRIGRDRLVRNVLVAIGNSGRPDLARATVARLEDDSALVRGAAAWALARLRRGG